MRGGNIIGFLIGGKTPGQFSVRRTDNFDVSDAVLLPVGRSAGAGTQVQLDRQACGSPAARCARRDQAGRAGRRRRAVRGRPGLRARQHGRPSVHRAAGSDVVLTLISDDNFSFLQRTLLLHHAGGAVKRPRIGSSEAKRIIALSRLAPRVRLISSKYAVRRTARKTLTGKTLTGKTLSRLPRSSLVACRTQLPDIHSIDVVHQSLSHTVPHCR